MPLTSRSDVLGLVGQIASLLVTSRVMLDLFNLFAYAVQLRIDPRCSLVQLHQEIQRANLELRFVDLYEKDKNESEIEYFTAALCLPGTSGSSSGCEGCCLVVTLGAMAHFGG